MKVSCRVLSNLIGRKRRREKKQRDKELKKIKALNGEDSIGSTDEITKGLASTAGGDGDDDDEESSSSSSSSSSSEETKDFEHNTRGGKSPAH